MTSKEFIGSLQLAIRQAHGVGSQHLESVPVHEIVQGRTIWQGTVEVFNISGHDKAERVYAWSRKGNNDTSERFITVLGIPPIASPRSAVKAAIAAEMKEKDDGFSWGEMGNREHFVQFYEDESCLVECVAQFIGSGLKEQQNTIVVATHAHRKAIAEKMQNEGVDIVTARLRGRYLEWDAEETLSMFMIRGMPDENRFVDAVGGLIKSWAQEGRGLRVFGEMVAVLLAAGNTKGAIRLEEIWNGLSKSLPFSLFCAYPSTGFCSPADDQSFLQICKEHSRVLPPGNWSEWRRGDAGVATAS